MKRHTPGCNCCGDVLIWNMHNEVPRDYSLWFKTGAPGPPNHSLSGNCCLGEPAHPCQPFIVGTAGPEVPITGEWDNVRNDADDNYKWSTYNFLREELEAAGARVDIVDRLNPDAWSGSLDDYKLLIWPQPNRTPDCSTWRIGSFGPFVPCCGGDDGPAWYDRVFNQFDPDPWQGRTVVLFTNYLQEVRTTKDWNAFDDSGFNCYPNGKFEILNSCMPEDFYTTQGWPGPAVNAPEYPATLSDGGCAEDCFINDQTNFHQQELAASAAWPRISGGLALTFLFSGDYISVLAGSHPLVSGLSPMVANPTIRIEENTELVFDPGSNRSICRMRDFQGVNASWSHMIADASLFNDRVGLDGPGYTVGQREFWVRCFTLPPGQST